MGAVDISPLVKGLLVVIGISLAVGQYGRLEHWARKQAVEALVWSRPLPYFFAPPRGSGLKGAPTRPRLKLLREKDRSSR